MQINIASFPTVPVGLGPCSGPPGLHPPPLSAPTGSDSVRTGADDTLHAFGPNLTPINKNKTCGQSGRRARATRTPISRICQHLPWSRSVPPSSKLVPGTCPPVAGLSPLRSAPHGSRICCSPRLDARSWKRRGFTGGGEAPTNQRPPRGSQSRARRMQLR